MPAETHAEEFSFNIGDFVDHRDGGFPAIVSYRSRGRYGDGRPGPEVYGVALLDDSRFGEVLPILGESLVRQPQQFLA